MEKDLEEKLNNLTEDIRGMKGDISSIKTVIKEKLGVDLFTHETN